MPVTPEDVRYMANLARLQLTEQETASLQEDMNSILEYMELLNKVDTTHVAPLEHVFEESSVFRADKAAPPLDHELSLKNAPDADADHFRVPKVIE